MKLLKVKELPQQKEFPKPYPAEYLEFSRYTSPEIMAGYICGWNSCLEELLGDNK